ncbi:MAG: hypothetical protein HWN68_16055 [Desulfobacterales bacterium]|nr:hypothetical protein [Desulfobacterales bacterium]
MPSIRRLPALDAIKEGVGRAVEMGRPVHHSMGQGQLTRNAEQTLVSASVLEYVAGLTASLGADLIVTVRHPEVLPVAQEIVRESYLGAGKPEAYETKMVRYLSSTQWSYVAGVMGIMQREKVAANILIGAFFADCILFAEAGSRVGAIQIGGTAGFGGNLAFLAVCCDYCLYGEEIYAARAYLTKDVFQIGGIRAQDICKLLMTGLIIVGLLLYNYSDWLYVLLSM